MNGEISFEIARMRMNQSAPSRTTEYQDEETATSYLHRAVSIMIRRHKAWATKDILTWIINICAAALKKASHAQAK